MDSPFQCRGSGLMQEGAFAEIMNFIDISFVLVVIL